MLYVVINQGLIDGWEVKSYHSDVWNAGKPPTYTPSLTYWLFLERATNIVNKRESLQNSAGNVAVYLSPAASPVSANLCAALRRRKGENKSARSTSGSPRQKPLDTNCPQLCLQAKHREEEKGSRDQNADGSNEARKLKRWQLSSLYSTSSWCLGETSELTSFPSLLEKNEWMDSSSLLPFSTSISFAMSNRRGCEKGGTVRKSPLKDRQTGRRRCELQILIHTHLESE